METAKLRLVGIVDGFLRLGWQGDEDAEVAWQAIGKALQVLAYATQGQPVRAAAQQLQQQADHAFGQVQQRAAIAASRIFECAMLRSGSGGAA